MGNPEIPRPKPKIDRARMVDLLRKYAPDIGNDSDVMAIDTSDAPLDPTKVRTLRLDFEHLYALNAVLFEDATPAEASAKFLEWLQSAAHDARADVYKGIPERAWDLKLIQAIEADYYTNPSAGLIDLS